MLADAAFVAVGFSVSAQSPARILVPTALLTALGCAVFNANVGAGTVWASGAAALVIGAATPFLARWLKAPTAAFAICAIIPMLPGVALYSALLRASFGAVSGLMSLVQAVSIALVLATGLSFGEYVAVVGWRQVRAVEHRVFQPNFVEPFFTLRRGPRVRTATPQGRRR
jgi:uncharacterized membrane protein YjjB (DUF3815 family)